MEGRPRRVVLCRPLASAPEMLTVETFKDWLRSSAGNRVAYKEMLEGIYRAYDLATKQGHEILLDALDQCRVDIPGVHSLHVEVLALKVLWEFPEAFEAAFDMLTVSRVDKFTIFRGKAYQLCGDCGTERKCDFNPLIARLRVEDKDTIRLAALNPDGGTS